MKPRDYGLIYVGWVLGWAAATLFMLATGCSRPPAPQLPGVLPVAVVSWPSPIKASCQLSDLPDVPDVFVWTQIADEEASRIYISQRQLADLVVWMKDVRHWAGLQASCLRKLTTEDQ